MAQADVGGTPVKLEIDPGQVPIVQNLGPGDVEVSRSEDMLFGEGIRLEPDAALAFSRPLVSSGGKLYVVQDGAETADADVRFLGL